MERTPHQGLSGDALSQLPSCPHPQGWAIGGLGGSSQLRPLACTAMPGTKGVSRAHKPGLAPTPQAPTRI